MAYALVAPRKRSSGRARTMTARTFVLAFSGSFGLGAWLTACGDDSLLRASGSQGPGDDRNVPTLPAPVVGAGIDASPLPNSPVPEAGSPETLDVGSWNIEWFGSPTEGPTDDDTQEANVRAVVSGAKLDVFAFEEVVDGERWKRAVGSVPSWMGLVASDPSVQGGAASYGPDEQKLAFAYDSRTIRVSAARILLAASSYDFAGRPPLEVTATYTTPDARQVPLTFVVLHLKAGGDPSAWARRQASIVALKADLDLRAATEAIFVIGDWNDEFLRSKTRSKGSPFAELAADTARYAFPTLVFEQKGISTMAGETFANDQHVLSIEAAGSYVADSATVLRVDEAFARYSDTTSDHYPIVSRYKP